MDSTSCGSDSDTTLLEPRRLLFPPLCPPSPAVSSNNLSFFPTHWTLVTLALAPKPHPSSPLYLLIATAKPGNPPTATTITTTAAGAKGKGRGRGRTSRRKPAATTPQPVVPEVKVERVCGVEIERALGVFRDLLKKAKLSTDLKNRREWWAIRRQLDQQMKETLDTLKEGCFQYKELSGNVLLILGRHLHQLPWECLFQDIVITRTLSLTFAAAHKAMVSF